MNRTKIDWCDYTWNPVVGCLHGCPYCYARRMAERFKGGKAYPFGFEPTSHLSKRIVGDKVLEIDHIRPRVFGGDHSIENLRTICSSCNSRKAQTERQKGVSQWHG